LQHWRSSRTFPHHTLPSILVLELIKVAAPSLDSERQIRAFEYRFSSSTQQAFSTRTRKQQTTCSSEPMFTAPQPQPHGGGYAPNGSPFVPNNSFTPAHQAHGGGFVPTSSYSPVHCGGGAFDPNSSFSTNLVSAQPQRVAAPTLSYKPHPEFPVQVRFLSFAEQLLLTLICQETPNPHQFQSAPYTPKPNPLAQLCSCLR
jgi:hypothetical protein